MTDYCTASDVTDNLKNVVITSSSVVTTDGMADIISQESAVIDQHIRPRYTLPVSDAVTLLFLKKVAIDLCVYRVSKILQPKVAAPIPDQAGQDISHVTAYREAMKMLKEIMAGKTILPGETETSKNFISSTHVNTDEPAAFDFCDADGQSDINVDLW